MHSTSKLGGFKYGLHQPEQLINFGVRCGSEVNLGWIDEMLLQFFGEVVTKQSDILILDNDDLNASELGWRCMLVARKLLQLAKTPVIEAGKLLAATRESQDSNMWKIKAVIPRLELVPNELIKLAYKEATGLIHWLLEDKPSKESVLLHREELFLHAIKPMRDMVHGGISTIPLLEAAHQLKIPFRHRGFGVYQLGWGSRLHWVDRSAIDRDSAIGARLSQDKFATANFLRDAGFPTPQHVLVNRAGLVVNAAEQLGWPVVVKPVNLDRSEGVTIGIRDRKKLLNAFSAAQNLSRNVLIEKEVPGTCYRLLVAGGQMRYAIRRAPPSLTADGTRTIAELISEREKASLKHPPWDRVKPILLDTMTLEALDANGLATADIPEAGYKVPLRLIESSEWRGDIDDVSNIVHPENIKLAERAAELFQMLNAGVDIITTDISRPWYETDAVINEINYAPYFGGNVTARAALPKFLISLMQNQGRIPIEVFVGQDQALNTALDRQTTLKLQGVRCYLTTHENTWNADGESEHILADGLFHRSLALLANRCVDALLLVIQNTELLTSGLPVDQITQIIDSNEPLLVHGKNGQTAPSASKAELLKVLFEYSVHQEQYV